MLGQAAVLRYLTVCPGLAEADTAYRIERPLPHYGNRLPYPGQFRKRKCLALKAHFGITWE